MTSFSFNLQEIVAVSTICNIVYFISTLLVLDTIFTPSYLTPMKVLFLMFLCVVIPMVLTYKTVKLLMAICIKICERCVNVDDNRRDS